MRAVFDPIVGVDVDPMEDGRRTAIYLTLPRDEALMIAKRWVKSIEGDLLERPYFRDYLIFPKAAVRDGRPGRVAVS